MLCSKCSHEIKPVVAFDIDGTLGRYHEHFRNFACEYFGRQLPMEYRGDREFHDHLGLTLHDYRAAKLAYRQGGLKRNMPAYPWAQTAVSRARETGCEVWIATTRPYNRLDNIDPDTVEWCRRNEIQFDGLIYGEDKYQQLVDHVEHERILFCMEDLSEQYGIANGLLLPVFLVPRQHNESFSFLANAMTLQHFTAQVPFEAARWRQEHGS